MWHWIYVLNVLKVVMNKKNPEQISSGSFNYLLNLGRVTSEGSRINVSINRNWLLPEVSPLLSAVSHFSLWVSPSNLKVVGALDNYSLVFVIFIKFFGQLKEWVGQVIFIASCPKGQVEKYVNVEAWTLPYTFIIL
jgi:hypothetical protein